MLSVSQKAQSRPFSTHSRSAIASINRAAPVINVASNGSKNFRALRSSSSPRRGPRRGSEASQPFWGVQIGDVYLDEDSIARRIRENFEGLLLTVERNPVQSRCVLEPCLDGRAEVDQALEELIVGRVNLIVGVASNLDGLQTALWFFWQEGYGLDDFRDPTAQQLGGDDICEREPDRFVAGQIVQSDRLRLSVIFFSKPEIRPLAARRGSWSSAAAKIWTLEVVRGTIYSDRTLSAEVGPVHALGDDKSPQPHEGAHGKVHGQEVAIEDLAKLAPTADLCSPAKIGAHNEPGQMAGKSG